MKKVRYMISDAANMMQVESHVLRYWEEELDLEVPRNEMGHRYYTEENIQQFRQIKKWKEEGYQLKAIKMMLHNENPDCEELLHENMANSQTGQAPAMQNEKNTEVPSAGQLPRVTSGGQALQTEAAKDMSRLEQFQLMMNDIVRNAIAENNQALGLAVGEQVGEKVIKEMNYLMREQEDAQEDRFRKLDEAIRSRQMQKRRLRREKKQKVPKEKKTRGRFRTGESTL